MTRRQPPLPPPQAHETNESASETRPAIDRSLGRPVQSFDELMQEAQSRGATRAAVSRRMGGGHNKSMGSVIFAHFDPEDWARGVGAGVYRFDLRGETMGTLGTFVIDVDDAWVSMLRARDEANQPPRAAAPPPPLAYAALPAPPPGAPSGMDFMAQAASMMSACMASMMQMATTMATNAARAVENRGQTPISETLTLLRELKAMVREESGEQRGPDLEQAALLELGRAFIERMHSRPAAPPAPPPAASRPAPSADLAEARRDQDQDDGPESIPADPAERRYYAAASILRAAAASDSDTRQALALALCATLGPRAVQAMSRDIPGTVADQIDQMPDLDGHADALTDLLTRAAAAADTIRQHHGDHQQPPPPDTGAAPRVP